MTAAEWGTIAELATALGTLILAVALRNAGNGIAMLHGWRFFPEMHRDSDHAPLDPLPAAARASRRAGRDDRTGLVRLGQQAREHRPAQPEMTGAVT